MLVLSRYVNECVTIGDVTVMVVAVAGNKVKLGIVAPQDRRIGRGSIRKIEEAIEATPARKTWRQKGNPERS